ncbi:MAG TPA: GNAT family N-acetyltransferase [Chitinophagaceae bacterium]|nr:GNAT family N-acetyltransferase [Chitinophagaceae bacterium]HNU14777.1 GNAT family N-acetyltransferase [Chitinophagaceae bacterium]
MGKLVIRYALPAEASLIADISRQTFYETFAESNTSEDMEKFMNEQFSRDTLIKETEEPGSIFLLAYDDAEPIGYAKVRDGEKHSEFNGFTSIEIARIYALKKSIGKGVGRELMQKCISIAREMNRDIIWLGVWEKNERAIQFYRKWGFEKFAEHEFILGNDVQTDWLMYKRLFKSE